VDVGYVFLSGRASHGEAPGGAGASSPDGDGSGAQPQRRDSEGISRFGRGHVRDTIAQLEADFPIWEHKVHRANPSLAIGEGPILAFRRWASRFYATAGSAGERSG
jgi:hypothetical protein